MPQIPYPVSPKTVSEELTAVSPKYKAQVIKVLLSMLLFIASYLLVFAIALGIFVGSLFVAVAILGAIKHWFGLILGLGVLLTAGMFFFFIVKFLFQTKKDTDDSRIEIFEKDQPDLFEFVKRVCEETKAPFPKRIVLSPHVNASVYYNSSFLSMFLPIRKNLEIGAGLLNCINLTEFKAVLAHEFGHFSQSSTRLGSYTYRFHKVVYNLLYENDGWFNALNSLTSWHSMLSFFGQLTVMLVKAAVSFFVSVYKVVNLSYLALSREMEFHADSVAVSVTGSKAIVTALYRLDFGQEAYNYTLSNIHNYDVEKAIYPVNFFGLHQRNLLHIAKQNGLILEQNLPVISTELVKSKVTDNRLKYKDLWASHPTIVEREESASRIDIVAPVMHESPWLLIKNAEKLQEELSKKIPELAQEKKEKETVDNTLLLQFTEKQELETSTNPIYKGYYDYASNSQAIPLYQDKDYQLSLEQQKPEEIFSAEILQTLQRYYKDVSDTETLRLISGGHLQVKRFMLDNKPYTRYYSNELYLQLKSETEAQLEKLREYNTKVSTWFYVKAKITDEDLADAYLQLLLFSEKVGKDGDSLRAILQELINLYNDQIMRHGDPDNRTSQVIKMNELYDRYTKLKEESISVNLPEALKQQESFGSDYKTTVFKTEVRNPGIEQNLEGFNDFYEDLVLLCKSIAPLENKIHWRVLKKQDEILLKIK